MALEERPSSSGSLIGAKGSSNAIPKIQIRLAFATSTILDRMEIIFLQRRFEEYHTSIINIRYGISINDYRGGIDSLQ